MKRILYGLSILIIMFAAAGIKGASAQLIYPVPCVSGKECAWFKVSHDDKTRYGIALSQSSVQFYDDQATKDKICQIEGYEFHPGGLGTIARTYNQWSSVNGEYHATWNFSYWKINPAGGVSYLDYIVCARSPAPPPSPSVDISVDPAVVSWGNTTEISWTSQNTTSCTASGDWSGSKSASGTEESSAFWFGTKTFTIVCESASGEQASDSATARIDYIPTPPTIGWSYFPSASVPSDTAYEIGVVADDVDGDLVRIDVTRTESGTNTAFDTWIGGGSYGYTRKAATDTGPKTITYSAIARDVYGRTSSIISRSVTIDAPVVPSTNAPNIGWESVVGTVASGQSYRVAATATDINGNLATVSVNKDGIPFAYDGGGDGYTNTSGNSTSDTGPKIVRFDAWATDSTGLRSGTITQNVTVGGLAQTATVSASVTCVAPGGSFTVTGNGSGSGITSNVLEKDSNLDGVFGSIASRSDAGTNSATVNVPSGETSSRYDFRTNLNDGTTLSSTVGVNISNSCGGVTPPPPTFCQMFPWLCPAPTPNYTFTVSKSGTGSGTVSGSGINCGSTCSMTARQGTVFILSAFPAAGSQFSGWSGGGCSGTGPCVVTLSGNTNVIATFNSTTLPPGPATGSSCTVNGTGRDGPLLVTTQKIGTQDYAMLSWSSSDYCAHFWNGSLSPRTQIGNSVQPISAPNSYGWTLYCWPPGSTAVNPTTQYSVGASCAPPPPPPSATYTASLAANKTCAAPTENVMFTSTVTGSPITSHVLEFDDNNDGAYTNETGFPAMSGAITYTKPYPLGTYRFRSVVNGSTHSNIVGLTISNSCPVAGTTCTDPLASNMGMPLPCQYGPVTPPPPPATGFTISGDDKATINFLASRGGDAQIRGIFVNPSGGFTQDVTIAATSIVSKSGGLPLPAGVGVSYSVDGERTFSPSLIEIMKYNSSNGFYVNGINGNIGLPFTVRLSDKVTEPYILKITGVSGGITSTHEIELNSRLIDPLYREI